MRKTFVAIFISLFIAASAVAQLWTTQDGNLVPTLQDANCVFAGPATGADAVPTCRALVAADLAGVSTVALIDSATASQLMVSGGVGGDPAWTTLTFPSTLAISKLLYASASNTVSGLTTANDSVLITSGTGVPSWSATLPTLTGLTVTGASANLNASSNFAVNIGTGTSTGAISIGSGTTTQAITIWSGTGDLLLKSTDDIKIGDNAVEQDIYIGNETTASSLALKAGTGNITIDGVAATTITIGDAAQTGAITIGASSATMTNLSLGTGVGAHTIHIGDGGTAAQLVTIGSTSAASGVTIQGGTAGITTTGTMKTATGAGTAGTGVAAVESYPAVRTATLTFTLTGANDIDVEDGGKSKGTLIWTAPAGVTLILGATINASITTTGTFNASTADVYYCSVGTVDGTQAADADLTSTEADVIAKTTMDTASGVTLVHTWTGYMGTLAFANNVFDGHTTATPLYLNVAVPDANATTATTHAVTGTLTVTYVSLGDYT